MRDRTTQTNEHKTLKDEYERTWAKNNGSVKNSKRLKVEKNGLMKMKSDLCV
jgi:hypothetical protein